MESSPWVLTVQVFTSRKDTDKHTVTKQAKCTIDTGNMQGNIVSRDFVEDVLELSPSNFKPLTAAEKEGGVGVTGHKLVSSNLHDFSPCEGKNFDPSWAGLIR